MSILAYCIFAFIFFILLACSAFFSGSETVLLSLSQVHLRQIEKENPTAAARLNFLLRNPDLMFSTILVGNTIVNTLLGSLGLYFFIATNLFSEDTVELVTVIVVTLFILFFGEITPKQLAVTHAQQWAPMVSRVVVILSPVFRPISAIIKFVLLPFQKMLHLEREPVTGEELLSLIKMGQEKGEINYTKSEMVRGALRLSDLNGSDVMTPRVELEGLDLKDSVEIWLETARTLPFIHLPVWDDIPDNFVGFLDVDGFLRDPKHPKEQYIIKDHVFQPENIALDDLMITMLQYQRRIVALVDEYGGIAGIATRGDILEVLSADMPEPDEGFDIVEVGENQWKIDGATSLEQINFQLGTHMYADDADRIAGWVMFHAKHMPEVGERVEADGYRAEVKELDNLTISTVILTDLNPHTRTEEEMLDEAGMTITAVIDDYAEKYRNEDESISEDTKEVHA